ncbi:MAG TPA: hypothetical protein VEZ48_06135 [Sphingomonadaceae bacterium]|nr:hypothetical protein [Sphingomonadaceae bacterium]
MAFRFRATLRKDLTGLPHYRVKAWHHLLASRAAGKRRPKKPGSDGAGEPVTPRLPTFLSCGAGAELIFDD